MEGHVQPQALDRWTLISFTPVANTEKLRSIGQVNQIKSNQIKKFYLKSVHFITVQHKLSRAFQTDMHNKLHKSNTAQ
jgi:hypothetical protein